MKISHTAAYIISLSCFEAYSNAFSPQSRFILTEERRVVNNRSSRRGIVSHQSNNNNNDDGSSSTTLGPQFDFSDPLSPVVFGEKVAIPFTKVSVEFGDGMVNDGLWSWLYPYLSLLSYKEGNTVVGGVATDKLTTNYSESDKDALRIKAKQDLVNISDAERERRRELSYSFYLASIVYAGLSSIILDDGSFGGHFLRFAVFMPLSLAYGLQLSANRGLVFSFKMLRKLFFFLLTLSLKSCKCLKSCPGRALGRDWRNRKS